MIVTTRTTAYRTPKPITAFACISPLSPNAMYSARSPVRMWTALWTEPVAKIASARLPTIGLSTNPSSPAATSEMPAIVIHHCDRLSLRMP